MPSSLEYYRGSIILSGPIITCTDFHKMMWFSTQTTAKETYLADVSTGCFNPPMTTGATKNSLHYRLY